jgi:hypothetical protein
MSHQLHFAQPHLYDIRKSGISIPLVLRVGNLTVKLDAKLDTGSIYCIFERYISEELGLRNEEGYQQRVSTITGSFTTYGHEVTLSMLGLEFNSMVFFAEDDSYQRNVIGRHGWLNKVQVGIIDYEGKLYLGSLDI